MELQLSFALLVRFAGTLKKLRFVTFSFKEPYHFQKCCCLFSQFETTSEENATTVLKFVNFIVTVAMSQNLIMHAFFDREFIMHGCVVTHHLRPIFTKILET